MMVIAIVKHALCSYPPRILVQRTKKRFDPKVAWPPSRALEEAGLVIANAGLAGLLASQA